VTKLLKEAKGSLGCIANKSLVFTYSAPLECGSGTLSISLHSASSTWSPIGKDSALTAHSSHPDALVACNAGLGSYREWFSVIQAAHAQYIPFSTTEYAEQSAEHQRGTFPLILSGIGASPRPMEDYQIHLNPFQRPGQRPLPMYRLPNVVNGFTLVVYKKMKAKNEDVKVGGKVGVERGLGDMSLEELD